MENRAPSIRLRLLGVSIVSILVTLAVAGISLVSVFEQQILKRVEQELEIHWTELATAFEIGPDGNPILLRSLTDPRYHLPFSGSYWQVQERGAVVMSSRSLWDETIDVSDPSDHDTGSDAFEVTGPASSTLYVISRPVTLDDGRHFQLSVALDHAEVDVLRQAFERDVAWILVPIAIVLVIAAWFQIRQSLNPLRDLDSELKAVHDGEQPRLGTDFPREMEPVVTDLNRLLDRQEQLVRKARDRAGALAHGLKTPLTILAGEARRLERRGEREAATRVNGQVGLIRRHVDRELARARTAGAAAAGGAFASAAATVDRLIRLMQHMPRGDAIDWRVDIPGDLTVHMDPDDFGEVLGNLLDNARKWARTTVSVVGRNDGEVVSIAVIDDGPGFTAGAFDRGLSGDTDEESSGLGLGIVGDILSEYGVALQVSQAEGFCRVAFALPVSGHLTHAPRDEEPEAEQPALSQVA
jgi:signal transduction histidine kinase